MLSSGAKQPSLNCSKSLLLTAELTARKKQYEYYRDLLLTFGDDVERKQFSKCRVLNEGNIPVILGGQEPAYYINKVKGSQLRLLFNSQAGF